MRSKSVTSMSTKSTTTDYSSMSSKELRVLLTRSGEDCKAYSSKRELVCVAKRLEATNFDDEAHKIFAQLNLQPTMASEYANLDAIWRHPSKGGGTIYVGNYVAASTRRILDERNITAVVNCQGLESENYFENDPKITYLRFPVAKLSHSRIGGIFGSKHAALKGMMPALDFLEQQIADGKNVLVHCLAGAHRAGTVGVAFLMYKTGLGVDEAIASAQKCRPFIAPFATLLALLRYLEKDLEQQRDDEEDDEEEIHV